jgi:uncharacterized protein (TIGR02453 family)
VAEGFEGFGPRALDFFRALAFHQDRAWFEENRALYEAEVLAPMRALVVALAAELARRGLPLTGDPKRSLFRINRDVRFSKDKRPFKTNAGAVLTRDGTKRSPGLLYVHVDPEGSFTAAGFFRPEPPQLAALRGRMRSRLDEFREMGEHLASVGLALSSMDDLTRAPRGFEDVTDEVLARALRHRHLIVRRALEPEALRRPDLVVSLADFAAEALPLLAFGWSALETLDPRPESAR